MNVCEATYERVIVLLNQEQLLSSRHTVPRVGYADAEPPFPAEQVDACVFNAQHNLAHLCAYELCTDAVRLSHGAAKPEARHCQAAVQRHRRNATHAGIMRRA